MEIIVNQEPLKFELTQTLKLPEVLDKISTWAAEKKLFIIEYQVLGKNEKEILKEKEAELTTNEIKKLNVIIGSEKDLLIENIYELSEYISKLGTFLASSIQNQQEIPTKKQKEIQEGLYWIHELVTLLLKQNIFVQKGHVNSKNNHIENICKNIHLLAEEGLPKGQENLMSFLDDLAVLKNQIEIWNKIAVLHNLTDEELNEIWNTFMSNLPDMVKDLEEIATQFTLGKEGEAVQALEGIINDLSDSVTIICLLNKTEYENWKKSIVEILQELMTSLDNKDYVTVADILDYDIKELLEKEFLDANCTQQS